MCRDVLGCLIIGANIIYLFAGIALTIGGGLVLWCEPVKQHLVQYLSDQLRASAQVDIPGIDYNAVMEEFWMFISPGAIALFCIGILVTVTAFAAFIGVCGQITAFLIIYAVITGVIVISLLISVSVYFAHPQSYLTPIHKYIEYTMINYQSIASGTRSSYVGTIFMQAGFCCGYTNGSNFGGANYRFSTTDTVDNHTFHDLKYPIPCCKKIDRNPGACPSIFTVANSNIQVGCKHAFDKQLVTALNYLMYGLSATFGVNLIMCCLVVGVIILRKTT